MCREKLNKNQKRKKRAGVCIEPYCRKTPREGANRCDSCAKKRYIQKDPERYIYQTLKDNAKRRKVHFDISLDDFKDFLKDNPDYIKLKGIKKKSLQIDRIDITKGYTKGNLQSISMIENLNKYHYYDKLTNQSNDSDHEESSVKMDNNEDFDFLGTEEVPF